MEFTNLDPHMSQNQRLPSRRVKLTRPGTGLSQPPLATTPCPPPPESRARSEERATDRSERRGGKDGGGWMDGMEGMEGWRRNPSPKWARMDPNDVLAEATARAPGGRSARVSGRVTRAEAAARLST